jgi:hypothetical protein
VTPDGESYGAAAAPPQTRGRFDPVEGLREVHKNLREAHKNLREVHKNLREARLNTAAAVDG